MNYNKGSDELLYIHTDLVTVTVKGTASHTQFTGKGYNEKVSHLKISYNDSFEILVKGESVDDEVKPSRLGREYIIYPLFFEQQSYEIIIESEKGHKVDFWHESYNIRKNITPVGRKEDILSGIINFGNDIGMSDFEILIDGQKHLGFTIEVFPSKIDYFDDYKAIIADVTAEVYNLVFDFLKKTYNSFDISKDRNSSSPVEFLSIIRKIYGELISAADMVIAKPHHILKTEHEVMPYEKIKRTDSKTVKWLENHPEYAVRTGNGIKAVKALSVKKYVTYDTNENRLVKYMLAGTAKRLENFRNNYINITSRETDNTEVTDIDKMINGIRHRCDRGFLKEVEALPAGLGMSLVFGMAPGYRELYRCYVLLQHGLSVTGNIFNLSVKDLAELYEYWCFIKLNRIMKDKKYRLESQDIIHVEQKGLFVSLVKGKQSSVRYLNTDNGEIITLSYNPKEISDATVPQRPDNVLCLEKKGSSVNYEYVFDAKYKIDQRNEYLEKYRTPGPKEEDINTMHRYRDAIVCEKEALPYERRMFGAYVLFPYHNGEEYRKHKFYKSIDKVNVGGLPFLPSQTELVTEMLDTLISDSPDSAFERAVLPVGIEEYLKKVDWNKKEVLIGLLDGVNKDNFDRRERFYCTKETNVSCNHLPVNYVALYRNKSGIEYYGKVISTELLDQGSQNGRYYKFKVEDWVPLTTPIVSESYGQKSVSYTNLFLLTHSTRYPELHIGSETEYRLYSEIKRLSQANTYIMNKKSNVCGSILDNTKVIVYDDKIKIYCNNQYIKEYQIEDFNRYPGVTFRKIWKCVEQSNAKNVIMQKKGNNSYDLQI